MSIQDKVLKSFNPATGDLVGELPVDSLEMIQEKVEAAHRAQEEWGRMKIEDRAKMIAPFANSLMEKVEEIAELLTKEQGKTLVEAMGEVKACANNVESELESVINALKPEKLTNGPDKSQILFDPLGVVVSITPWNFPILMPQWHLLPALMAGNSVIIKPSEETTLTAKAYIEILQSHLPNGVLQMVVGDGVQGQQLIDQNIQLTVFTGSRDVGQKIMEQSSSHLKRVILELGGKDPLVVLSSADLDKAVGFAVQNSFRNCGQVCVSTERILVSEDVYDNFLEKFSSEAKKLKYGNGLDHGVSMGSMIHGRQKAKVLEQVEDAVAKGAKVYFGETQAEGNFLGPIILTEVNDSMEILDGETFGPVVYVDKFKSTEELVNKVNSSRYGLGAAIFGAETPATEIATQLKTGMVGINRGVSGVKDTPWVGAKESGFGFHHSHHGHRQFTQTRVITVRS